MKWTIVAVIILLCIGCNLLYRYGSKSFSDKNALASIIALVVAIAGLLQSDRQYREVAKIEYRIKNVAEAVGELIADNQAWANRYTGEGEALKRMKDVRLRIDSYLAEIGTNQAKRKLSLRRLDEMIAKDEERERIKKKQ